VGSRRVHYTYENAYPTLSPTLPTVDTEDQVILGNLGGVGFGGVALDGDVLTYSASDPSRGTVVVAQDGSYIYTPDADLAHNGGTDTFTASVSGIRLVRNVFGYAGFLKHVVPKLAPTGTTAADTTVVTVNVPIGLVNAAPTVDTPTLDAADIRSGAISGRLAATDADGDTAVFAIGTAPARGTVVVDAATGTFTYTPSADARHAAAANSATAADQADTFTIAVSDGYGGTVVVPVSVTVTPANSAPSAAADTCIRDCVDGGGVGDVIGSDTDGDVLTYTVTTSPDHGSVSINSATGAFTYTPAGSQAAVVPAGSQAAVVERVANQASVASAPGVLPAGALGTVTGNTPDTWQTYTFTYTPSTTGANFIGFAFRQDPAFWSFDNAQLFETGSTTNLFTNGEFSSGGEVAITTNNGPSTIDAPANWGVWYQDGTYPAAAGSWNGGFWYDGAVGTFDGIYQGVNLTGGTQYTVRFDVSGNDVANIDDIQLGVYGGTCQDSGGPAASCSVPASSGFATLARPDQTTNAGSPSPSWPTDSFVVTVTDGHGGSIAVPVTVTAC
jgi:VCBS repeat-containing protein